MSKSYSEYREALIGQFWSYAQDSFDGSTVFDQEPSGNRPPVFKQSNAFENILVNESFSAPAKKEVLASIPPNQRHRWFRSMTSSQALAQTVFGNLGASGKLNILCDLKGDDDRSLFWPAKGSPDIVLEYDCEHLNEPRKTSVDVFLPSDNYKIAVECKLTEPEVGTCSRPRLTPKDSNYEDDYCDGSYRKQGGRKERCSLTEIDILYWRYIPELFTWKSDIDYEECPLRFTYQLVRNVLAACVEPGGGVNVSGGHAVLLYDERNPAFQRSGKGIVAWNEVKRSLINPALLQKCTWQQVVSAMRQDSELNGLTEALSAKYGL